MVPSTSEMMECGPQLHGLGGTSCKLVRRTSQSVEVSRSCEEKAGPSLCAQINCKFETIDNKCLDSESVEEVSDKYIHSYRFPPPPIIA